MLVGSTNQLFATALDISGTNLDQYDRHPNALFIFDTHRMILGNDIKNLVILIPNERHHGPQQVEDGFIDQPFVPETAVVNKGTNIIWFNGDVDH